MRNYAGTFKGICRYNPVYNLLIQLLPLQSSDFVVDFSSAFWHGNEPFPKGSSQKNEIVPFLEIFYLLLQGCENMFSLVLLSKSNFFTCVALMSFVQHSCRTRVVCVALVSLVSDSCHTRVVRVALVLLVSHSCHKCQAFVL